jgi:hypothetical protein
MSRPTAPVIDRPELDLSDGGYSERLWVWEQPGDMLLGLYVPEGPFYVAALTEKVIRAFAEDKPGSPVSCTFEDLRLRKLLKGSNVVGVIVMDETITEVDRRYFR